MLRHAVIAAALFVAVVAGPAAAGVNPDLQITMTDSPDPVVSGGAVTYTIEAVSSADASSNVQMSDSLPAGTTFESLTAPSGWSCTVPAVGASGTVTCTIAALPLNTPATFTLVVRVDPSVPDGATLSNTASATTSSADTDPGNNSATQTTTVSSSSSDLAVTLTDTPDPVAPGSTITYSADVTNSGPSDAQGVTFSDTLPASTTFVSVSVPSGWTCSSIPAPGATGTVTCSRATLAAGAPTQTFTLVVAVSASATPGGTISNTATVDSTSADPVSANDTATATTAVAGGDDSADDDQVIDDPPPLSGTPLATTAAGTPPPAGRRLICRRVPTLRRHSISGARFILARDGCRVKLRWVGRYRRGGRRTNRITSQSVRPGTPLYEGDTLVVRINGRRST